MADKEKETEIQDEATSTPEGKAGDTSKNKVSENAETKTSAAEGKKAEGEKTFTQDELNEIVGKVRNDGREAGLKDALKKLGVEDLDAAVDAVKKAKELEEANLSEKEKLEKRIQELEDANKKASQTLSETESQAMEATIKAAVVDQAASKFESGEAVYQLLDRFLITVDDNGDVVGVDKALEKVAEKYPFTVRKGKAGVTNTSVTNPENAEKVGTTDDQRRKEYFGLQDNEFWQGSGVRRIAEE
jgi:predicted ribosome quality control (RQC) complex YloA/Tae2 family protein